MAKFRGLGIGARTVLFAAFALFLAALAGAGYLIDSAASGGGSPAYANTLALAVPKIVSEPANPTTATSATFTFSDTTPGATYKCSLDSTTFSTCTSGITHNNLSFGSHTFSVEAVSGNQTSTAASYTWSVIPTTPTITSEPANPTASITAAFRYSDTTPGVTFVCSLDKSSYSACTSSGVIYNGLANGSHTFSVEAVSGHASSSAASYIWTVDTTPPKITVTFPVTGKYYNAAGWTAGCSPVGVCGAASDPVGVTGVSVGVEQMSTARYWNGSSFSSTSLVLNKATGATAWTYPLARPVDGAYRLFVSATDTLGNTTPVTGLTTSSFTIDTVAPAAPQLLIEPPNPTTLTAAVFAFVDSSWPNVTFSCRLDSGSYSSCNALLPLEGGAAYANLTAGRHCFYVYATDLAGNQSPTTSYCWTITGATTASSIAVSSGSPQYTTVSTAYASPLVAEVTNSQGNPVSGATVTFSAPSSGASGAFATCPGTGSNSTTCVETTNSSGLATSTTFTANATPGAFAINASVSGTSSPAAFSLTNVANFTMSGNISGPFYPGTSQSVNLSITNPNPAQITIPAGSITITVTTSNQAQCPGATNFTMSQSLTQAVPVAGNSTDSLSQLDVPTADWPIVKMIDTNTNQDACENLTLTLHYSGSAQG